MWSRRGSALRRTATLDDMVLLSEWIADAGGVLHKRQLVALGARDRDLTRAVRSGDVRRPRRGWYSTLPPTDPRFVAVAVGGRLTGAAAVALVGGWLWLWRPPITVSVPRNAARLRPRKGVKVVYDPPDVIARGGYSAVSMRDALRRAVLEVSFEEAVSLWDWASKSDCFEEGDLDKVAAALPADARGVTLWADRESQSFPESITRVRIVQAGHTVTSQEPVGAGQAIDLVVDGVVGLEVDGREFHADTFEKDRDKDLSIVLGGRSSMRVSFAMIRDSWPRIAQALDCAVSQRRDGSHVQKGSARPPSPRRGRGHRLWRLPPWPASTRPADATAHRSGTTKRPPPLETSASSKTRRRPP